MTRVPLQRPRAAWALVPSLAVAIGVACSSPQPTPPPTIAPPPPTPAPAVSPAAAPTPSPLPAAAPSAIAPGVRPAASPSPAVVSLGVVAGHSGSDLRTTLDVLLQEHVYLTAAAIDAAANGRQDEVGAAAAALDQSSTSLAEIIGAVKGADVESQFIDAWRRRIGSLVDYARATAAQDANARAAARADVDNRGASLAQLMALGNLSPDTVQTQLGAQTQALIGAADSLAAHDTSGALSGVRGAATHVDDLGRPLASAVAAQARTQAPGPTEGPDIDLRTHLDLLLEERAYLGGWAVDAAALQRDPEADAARAADDANAAALGDQLSDSFGSDVATKFGDLWKRQSADLVSYARASASNNNDARQQAQSDLDALRGDMDGLLSSANALLPPGAVADAARPQVQSLIGAADAFVGRDYVNGYTRVRDAARASQRLGDQLAQTTVDQFPTRFLASGTPGPSTSGAASGAGAAPASGGAAAGAGAAPASGGAAGAAGAGGAGAAGVGGAGGAGAAGAAGGAGATGATGAGGAAGGGATGAAGGTTSGGTTGAPAGTGAGAPTGPTGALTQPTTAPPAGATTSGGTTGGGAAGGGAAGGGGAAVPTVAIPVISVPTVGVAPAGGTGTGGTGGTGTGGAGTGAAGTGAGGTGTGATGGTGTGTGGTGTGATGTGGTGTGATGGTGTGTGGTGTGATGTGGTGTGGTGAGGAGTGGGINP